MPCLPALTRHSSVSSYGGSRVIEQLHRLIAPKAAIFPPPDLPSLQIHETPLLRRPGAQHDVHEHAILRDVLHTRKTPLAPRSDVPEAVAPPVEQDKRQGDDPVPPSLDDRPHGIR